MKMTQHVLCWKFKMTECFNNFKYQVRVGDLALTGTGITRSTNPLCGRISKKSFFKMFINCFLKYILQGLLGQVSRLRKMEELKLVWGNNVAKFQSRTTIIPTWCRIQWNRIMSQNVSNSKEMVCSSKNTFFLENIMITVQHLSCDNLKSTLFPLKMWII
jgi:hypothetical protein